MQSLNDVIIAMDNVAKIPAMRGIVHSTMAQAIGAIRQDIRNRNRTVREETDGYNQLLESLDQRNQYDENHRSHDAEEAMGFEVEEQPLTLASKLVRVFTHYDSELRTIATSRFDTPLTLPAMLEFMANKAQTLDKVTAEAIAKAAKCDVNTVLQMHEIQEQQERKALLEASPEIIATFEGMMLPLSDDGDSIDELPVLRQHQLAIKMVEQLDKAKNNLMSRVIRTRRIADLGAIPLFDHAIEQMKVWIDQCEERYQHEFSEALDAGRNIRTLDDIR